VLYFLITDNNFFKYFSEVGVCRWITLDDKKYKSFGSEHDAPIISVALDPQEKFAATASGDGSVRIWHLETGDCVHSILDILTKTNNIR
jgi:WD40 repeat protein